jgi:hypothetical protein
VGWFDAEEAEACCGPLPDRRRSLADLSGEGQGIEPVHGRGPVVKLGAAPWI